MYDFEYFRPKNVEGALQRFRQNGSSRYLAGGMTLLPVLKMRLDQPGALVDLGYVDEMNGVSLDGDILSIGAMTPHALVAASDIVKNVIPALSKLAGSIGDPLVRNRGTIGGSIANNDPSADYPSAILGLGATIITDQRNISADDFIVDMFETALEDGELIKQVLFPVPLSAGYSRFANPASRYPLVGVFVSKFADHVRVGVTGAGPHAFRLPEMEVSLANSFTKESIADTDVPYDDFISDIHATKEYRAHLVRVMSGRAVIEANK